MVCIKKTLFYCLIFKLQNRECKRITERYVIECMKKILKALDILHYFSFKLQDKRATRHYKKEEKYFGSKIEVRATIKNRELKRSKIKRNIFYIRTGRFSYVKIEINKK